MKLSTLIPAFAAHKSKTETALDENKAALATANNTISDLSSKVTALQTAIKAKADESADSDSDLDSFISDLQELINKYSSDESDESDDSSDDTQDTTDESDADGSDESDDANDESAKKAKRAEKLKGLAKSVTKIVADNKKLKDELPKQVIREIASVGIPTPISTKVDGTKPALTGRARVAAAFAEQFNK